jgi:hypothetical protein
MMKPTSNPPAGLALVATIATLLVACAQTPARPEAPLASLDCAALASEIHAAAEAQRAAAQQRQDAWKAVVPFAVAARYAKGKAAEQQLEQQLAELQQHAARQRCPAPLS